MTVLQRLLPLAGGVRLAVRQAGGDDPAKPRVLCLHGFPEAGFVWDGLLQQLAPQARIWAPDLRGYGASDAPAGVQAYRAKHLVADLVQLIEAQGGPLDVLVAHDWGGALAWNLAAQRPDLLRRLLIINAPHPAALVRELRHSAAQQAASAYMNFFCRPDAAALLAEDDFARLWPFFGAAPRWLTPALRQQYRDAWQRGLDGPLNYYRASPLRPPVSADDLLHTLVLPDEAVTVTRPTTLLWGEQDHALLPGLLDGLGRWVPDLHLQRVPQASHWLLHEQPALVLETLRAELGRARA